MTWGLQIVYFSMQGVNFWKPRLNMQSFAILISVLLSSWQGRVLCEMPALADRNSILIKDTRLENAIICQPQQRNMHGRIFGGFLMRRAFEIAFSTCYVFGGIRPLFLEVDHVDFRRPVGRSVYNGNSCLWVTVVHALKDSGVIC